MCDSILRHQFCEVAKNGDDPQEDIAKNGDDPQEHIAKFGNKIHMKVKIKKKKPSFYMFGYILGTHVQKSSLFFLNFDQNLAIEKSQEVLDFSTFQFLI